SEISTRLPFFVAAALGLIGGILSIFMLTEPKKVTEVAADKTEVTTSNFKRLLHRYFSLLFSLSLSRHLVLPHLNHSSVYTLTASSDLHLLISLLPLPAVQ